MNTKQQTDTLTKINRLIDEGNVSDIEEILDKLPCSPPNKSVTDVIAAVKEAGGRKEPKMKLKFKTAAIAAAAVAAVCVTAGAATLLNTFSFFENGKYVTVTSNGNLSENDAKQLAKAAANEELPKPTEDNTVLATEFETIEAAEKAYNMKAVIPSALPSLPLESVSGSRLYADSDSSTSTIWINYGSIDEKAFGITVTKNDFKNEDVTTTTVTDAKDTGEVFKTENGINYSVLTDSSDDDSKTALVYSTNISNYEYALIFAGFTSDEAEKIVNSADLSEYIK